MGHIIKHQVKVVRTEHVIDFSSGENGYTAEAIKGYLSLVPDDAVLIEWDALNNHLTLTFRKDKEEPL